MLDLAVCVSYDSKSNIYETIDAIKAAGFKKVFVQWYDKDWRSSSLILAIRTSMTSGWIRKREKL